MKKAVFPILIAVFLLAGCGANGNEKVTTGEIGVIQDDDFGGTYIDETLESFGELGFDFGDSVDFAFDNGVAFEDVPYYSGYYGSMGDLMLACPQGYEHVIIARKYGGSTWEEFHMTPSSKVIVTLNEKGKYLETEEVYNLTYSDVRNDYPSDEVFANYREVKGGKLMPGLFYRSASPCNNEHNRAPYANGLAEESGIRLVLNLSDTKEEYDDYKSLPDFSSFYYDGLCEEGKILFMDLGANYSDPSYQKAVSEALLTATASDGPILSHCVEGKDRTGFVSVLILSLADADYDEIISDYMITFSNYYGITKESEPERYDVIKADADGFLYYLCGAEKGTPMEELDFHQGAENYLRQGGLSDEEIQKVSAFLRGE